MEAELKKKKERKQWNVHRDKSVPACSPNTQRRGESKSTRDRGREAGC